MESLSDDSKVSTKRAVVALEWQLEMKEKWEKVGEPGTKRTELCSNQKTTKVALQAAERTGQGVGSWVGLPRLC